jgi:hypothetical protein
MSVPSELPSDVESLQALVLSRRAEHDGGGLQPPALMCKG